MADDERRFEQRDEEIPEVSRVAERAFESGIDEDAADLKAAVDADIAAANSDIEAAAEEMGARQSLESPQPEASLEQPEDAAASFVQSWPSVQPTFRTNMAEEAARFFAFAERLRNEFGGAAESVQESVHESVQATVPVDRPDPADNALIGPAEGQAGAPPTAASEEGGTYTDVPPFPEDEESAGEAPAPDGDEPGDGFDEDGVDKGDIDEGRLGEPDLDEGSLGEDGADDHGFEHDDFYVGDDGYGEEADVEVDAEAGEYLGPDDDESEY